MAYKPYCTTSYYLPSDATDDNSYEVSNMDFDLNSFPITTESTIIINSTDPIKKPLRRSKHIPHHLRPRHLVEKRNRRERRRVHDVNQAFLLLQALLPINRDDDNKNTNKEKSIPSRISKVHTLRKAIDYIQALQNILNETN